MRCSGVTGSSLECGEGWSLAQDLVLVEFHGLSLNINHGGKRIGFIDAWEDDEVKRGVWVEYVYLSLIHI